MLGDIAVANGTYTLHHKVNRPEVEKRACSPTYSSACATAGCASTRSAPQLREDAIGHEAKKQSTAEEPFHIPFFSRGEKSTTTTTTTTNPQQ